MCRQPRQYPCTIVGNDYQYMVLLQIVSHDEQNLDLTTCSHKLSGRKIDSISLMSNVKWCLKDCIHLLTGLYQFKQR